MQNAEEKDINEVFEDLLFSEERLIQDGYKEGFDKAAAAGNIEGYHLGYHRGAEIGAELGYYFGVCKTLMLDETKLNSKAIKPLENITFAIQNFPKTNKEDVDIIAEFDQIKTLYKKICALQKLDAPFPEVDQLSF